MHAAWPAVPLSLMPHTDIALPHVDSRVQIGGCKAAVRYVGEVQGQTGAWVGLEWDDVARGKNDGSTGGRSYFDCRSAGSGSFLRLEKFASQAELGQTVLAALQRRYGDQGFTDVQTADNSNQAPNLSSKKGVEWQFVGADKVHARQAQLQSLEKATLINCCISSVVSTLAVLKR